MIVTELEFLTYYNFTRPFLKDFIIYFSDEDPWVADGLDREPYNDAHFQKEFREKQQQQMYQERQKSRRKLPVHREAEVRLHRFIFSVGFKTFKLGIGCEKPVKA